MKTVWQQIRVGRHPGFEEGLDSSSFCIHHRLNSGLLSLVWPLIAMNLEFKPRSSDAMTGEKRENMSAEIGMR